MHIKAILSQHRRDFRARFKCENCGYECTDVGYDDAHYHNIVLPEIECPNCLKKAPDDYVSRKPLYPDGMEV